MAEQELDDILGKAALGGPMDYSVWPQVLPTLLARIEKISLTEFSIPNLRPPHPAARPPSPRFLAPLPSSDPFEAPDQTEPSSSQGTNKENADPSSQQLPATAALPKPVADMLDEILSVLRTNFTQHPPHTIQRLSELVLFPRQHYRNLVPYLHALDRVVHVTSGANTYPLPPALPEIGAMSLLANGPGSAAAGGLSIDIAAANTPGSDEALGGALLTPIPWLARRANGTGSEDGSDAGSSSPLSASGNPAQFQLQSQQQRQGGQLEGRVRTESTETIEGPNGIGSIETVSVSVNGIPSTGAAAALLTQRADLVRQQQQQAQGSSAAEEDATMGENAEGEDEDEIPHARGPEEIGLADTGPQSALAASYIADGGTPMDVEAIDVEAAVGRRLQSPPAQQSKREAADHLEPESPRKRKKDDELASSSGGNGGDQEPAAEQQPDAALPDAATGTAATDSATESSKPEAASATGQSGDIPSEPVDVTGAADSGSENQGG